MEQLFSKIDLQGTLDHQARAARDEIDKFPEDYLLEASEEDLVAALTKKMEWEAPVLGEPYIASDREIDVPRRDEFNGRLYTVKGSQIDVRIPFQGDQTFFRFQPSSRQLNVPEAAIHPQFLEVTFKARELTAVNVRTEISNLVRDLKFHLDQIMVAAQTHNATIGDKIRSLIQARKTRILQRREMVANIGLAMEKRDNAPTTYTVPDIRRKPQIVMPVVKGKPFVPEPALAEKEYDTILSIIRNMVSVMERSPKAFQHLKEEDLRWHFLFQLNGQYEGRATGETFNYKGDTDILIRENDRNVFIAECKFWKGKQSLSDTIDQLVDRYLHWRDTKTAILLFNRNKEFSKVLAQVRSIVEEHPCFKRNVSHAGDTEWRFILRSRDDANREIYLTLLVFDVPREP